MEQTFYQLFEQYGIYAVLALCTIEGDITLLLAGVLAQNGYFGPYSFLKVLVFGTLGGMIGDTFSYFVGRLFRETVKNYGFYKMAQPRLERLTGKFGSYSLVVSKYIYGVRTAMCLFSGVGRMPIHRFLLSDFISCSLWVLVLSSVGFFFSGAITTIIGDFKQIGIALFFILLFAVVVIYLVESFLVSERIEEASPETIHRLEEKIHNIEEKLHIGAAGQLLHRTFDQTDAKKDFDSKPSESSGEEADSGGSGNKSVEAKNRRNGKSKS